MRILLFGEASFLHNTLKKGLAECGHDVLLASDGNNWHNSPRDIDLRRNMRWGKLGGLKVLWKLLVNVRKLVGNDVVQIHNYQFVPLKMKWNELILRFLKRHNRCIVKGCYGDDPFVLKRQAEGVPAYSDTYYKGKKQNVEANRARLAEMELPEVVHCWSYASRMADALVPCLYEYWLCYDVFPYNQKLHYIPLPMEIPAEACVAEITPERPLTVLVGIQPGRDYIKGARYIAGLVRQVADENPGRIDVKVVEGVPYDEYCRLLGEADVLVDQLYSYTPSMNSLAAMARGTVVIGGGEEDFYGFIGENKLRPIINVRPGEDEYNLEVLRRTLLDPVKIMDMKRQGIEFVRKYHDYSMVSRMYIDLYNTLIQRKFGITSIFHKQRKYPL